MILYSKYSYKLTEKVYSNTVILREKLPSFVSKMRCTMYRYFGERVFESDIRTKPNPVNKPPIDVLPKKVALCVREGAA